ncbi:MAG TPA: 30S ribosomal protein S15 [Candidatus Micrarchaeota archaeon]|nr:30S ribosomal protein S15 [Candidatus Micrarchaeota archaeon]
MARMHSKKHGKSGSKRPVTKASPEWVGYSSNDVEENVSKLYKEGLNATSIGQKLRDIFGVPSVRNITNKRISQIIVESGGKIEYPDELLALIKRAMSVRRHLAANKSDKHNTVKLSHIEAKINRLVKYYRKVGKLPSDWTYDPVKAALLVK